MSMGSRLSSTSTFFTTSRWRFPSMVRAFWRASVMEPLMFSNCSCVSRRLGISMAFFGRYNANPFFAQMSRNRFTFSCSSKCHGEP